MPKAIYRTSRKGPYIERSVRNRISNVPKEPYIERSEGTVYRQFHLIKRTTNGKKECRIQNAEFRNTTHPSAQRVILSGSQHSRRLYQRSEGSPSRSLLRLRLWQGSSSSASHSLSTFPYLGEGLTKGAKDLRVGAFIGLDFGRGQHLITCYAGASPQGEA